MYFEATIHKLTDLLSVYVCFMKGETNWKFI